MAKCICCGNKIGMRDTFYYVNVQNKAFCEMCIQPIKEDINLLMRAEEESEETSLALNNLYKFAQNKNEETKEEIKNARDKFFKKVKNLAEKEQYIEYYKQRDEQKERIKNVSYMEALNILVTTSHCFEGYKIAEYLDIVSGDVVLGTGILSEVNASVADILGDESDKMSGKIEEAREKALIRMKKQAIAKGANAIVSVNFNISTMARNMIGLFATGTAVVIKKNN